MTDIQQRREAEFAKYEKAYQSANYKMGDRRKAHIKGFLEGYPLRDWGILDVGCGRGELLDMASDLGCFWDNVYGFEVNPGLCDDRITHIPNGAQDLPCFDDEHGLVTCCDVMEHLLEEDVPLVIAELYRVARKRVLLTVAYFPSGDLHITVKPREWWLEQFGRVCDNVIEHEGWHPKSGTFELVKEA